MSERGLLPEFITAGESIWVSASSSIGVDIVIPDYTPLTHSLSYQFAADTPIAVSAVANGDNTGWTLDVTSAQTLVWKAGVVRFAALATNISTARVVTVDSGAIRVAASPLATSSWTAVVTACDAAILSFASNPNASFSVDGMSVSYRSMDDLISLRSYAQTMADQERGSRMKRIIRTRFT